MVGVVLEVEAVAGAELQHPAAQVGERLAAVFGDAAAFRLWAQPGVDPAKMGWRT